VEYNKFTLKYFANSYNKLMLRTTKNVHERHEKNKQPVFRVFGAFRVFRGQNQHRI
jgi:hypothetical protein